MLKLYIYVETATLQFFQILTLQCMSTFVGKKCKNSFPQLVYSVSSKQKSIALVVARVKIFLTLRVYTPFWYIVTLFILRICVVNMLQVSTCFPKCRSWIKDTRSSANLIYATVTGYVISTMPMWLTDQHGKLLDLREEELTIRFIFVNANMYVQYKITCLNRLDKAQGGREAYSDWYECNWRRM